MLMKNNNNYAKCFACVYMFCGVTVSTSLIEAALIKFAPYNEHGNTISFTKTPSR